MEDYDVKIVPVNYERRIKLSFCAVIMEYSTEILKNIEKIKEMAEDTGISYEFIISTRFNIDYYSENIVFIYKNFNTYAMGKQLAFKHTTGDYLIILNLDRDYPGNLADMIYNITDRRENRAFIYEPLIISRELIEKAGGWRNLREYEDIDLLARIVMYGAVIAIPSENYDVINYKKLKHTSFIGRLKCLRDAAIACNFKLSDLIMMKKEPIFMSLISYISSRLSYIKPYKNGLNNYIIIIESIIESLILKDYENYFPGNEIPLLHIPAEEQEYLNRKSELWVKLEKSLPSIIDNISS